MSDGDCASGPGPDEAVHDIQPSTGPGRHPRLLYTIEHVAALFHVKVDSAREYTYRKDFPPAHQLGARLLSDREEILVWFPALHRPTGGARPGGRRPAGPAGCTYLPVPAPPPKAAA